MPTKRGNSYQEVVYHHSLPGGRARRQFSSPTEAKAWKLDSQSRLMRGEVIDMGEGLKQPNTRKSGLPYTLTELVEHVSKSRWAASNAGSKYRANALEMVGLIGPNMAVAKLNKADIDKARGTLISRGNQPATVNRKVAALSSCLTEAEDMGLIDSKPKCAKYKESESRLRRFTPEEEEKALRFFERTGNVDLSDWLKIGLDTGLRVSEVLNLRFDDARDGKVTVWGTGSKSGKTRTVPLTSRAKGIVEDRQKSTPDAVLVFPDLSQRSVNHHWNRMAEHLKVDEDPQFVPHILRHEFCSRLADRGLNAPIIQALAGHSSLVVTQRYIHINGELLAKAINELVPA